jgi:hypothetical protein
LKSPQIKLLAGRHELFLRYSPMISWTCIPLPICAKILIVMGKLRDKHRKSVYQHTIRTFLQPYKKLIFAVCAGCCWAARSLAGNVVDHVWPEFKSAFAHFGVWGTLSDKRGVFCLFIFLGMLFLKYAFVPIGAWYSKQLLSSLPKNLRGLFAS